MRPVDLADDGAHAGDAGRDAVAVALHLHLGQLLGLAVDLAAADEGLLGRHGHEDRVLAQAVLVAGLDADPAGPEDGQPGHLDPGDGDAHQRLGTGLERRRQDGGDDLGIGLVDGRHRLGPDVGLLGLDLPVHLLGAGAVADTLSWSLPCAHHARRICVGSNALQVVWVGQSSGGKRLRHVGHQRADAVADRAQPVEVEAVERRPPSTRPWRARRARRSRRRPRAGPRWCRGSSPPSGGSRRPT